MPVIAGEPGADARAVVFEDLRGAVGEGADAENHHGRGAAAGRRFLAHGAASNLVKATFQGKIRQT